MTDTPHAAPAALPGMLVREGDTPDLSLVDSVTLAQVLSAAEILRGAAHRTPVMTSRTLDAMVSDASGTATRVHLKCENFQRVGAFKFRGAYHALSRLDDDTKRRGVLTYSSGNHAQGLACAAALLGIPATIVMPKNAPAVKLAATRAYLANAPDGPTVPSGVIEYDPDEAVREVFGRQIAEERGLVVIPPYDHPDIIAGQGTATLELIEDAGALDDLFVCCGGGGLLSGAAVTAKALLPGVRVVGVEPELADDAARSFRSGKLCMVRNPQTIADGTRTPSMGRYTFPLVRTHVDDIATVSEAKIARATLFMMERMKLVVEPSGALGVAGLLQAAASGALSLPASGGHERRVGVIVSGGNLDLAMMPELRRLAATAGSDAPA